MFTSTLCFASHHLRREECTGKQGLPEPRGAYEQSRKTDPRATGRPRGTDAEGSCATLFLQLHSGHQHTNNTDDFVTALHLLPLSLLPEPVMASNNLYIKAQRYCSCPTRDRGSGPQQFRSDIQLCCFFVYSFLVCINQGDQRPHNRGQREPRPHSSYGTAQLGSRIFNFKGHEAVQHCNACLQHVLFWYFALS